MGALTAGNMLKAFRKLEQKKVQIPEIDYTLLVPPSLAKAAKEVMERTGAEVLVAEASAHALSTTAEEDSINQMRQEYEEEVL